MGQVWVLGSRISGLWFRGFRASPKVVVNSRKLSPTVGRTKKVSSSRLACQQHD